MAIPCHNEFACGDLGRMQYPLPNQLFRNHHTVVPQICTVPDAAQIFGRLISLGERINR